MNLSQVQFRLVTSIGTHIGDYTNSLVLAARAYAKGGAR